MKADDVLDVLRRYQDSLNWLANDGRQHLAAARLSLLRSDEHFAVCTEFPHFFYGTNEFDNWLGCAGDCLIVGANDTRYQPRRAAFLEVEQVPDAPLWADDDCTQWIADRAAFSVLVEGQRHDFTPSAQDYECAGIVFEHKPGIIFEDERRGPNTINPGQFLRFVSFSLNHPFFLSEAELRGLTQPSVEPQMSLFLQTGWWQHPTYLIAGDDPIFRASFIENILCWQILARAIASGDLSEWNSQDTSGFNTDWASLERIYHQHNIGYSFD
ncbi:hypothetical protein IAD21_03315 [Abditibacteriota bacterium]|nr:hypothetical protein IAD21_03315 [Abditibacteriota bacterium]